MTESVDLEPKEEPSEEKKKLAISRSNILVKEFRNK